MNQSSTSLCGVNQQLQDQETCPPSFWGTRYEAIAWATLILVAAYAFFGIGILSGLAALITVFSFQSAKRDKVAKTIRSLFTKVAITGIAYQFMGLALISAPNIVNANRFFEDASVEANVCRLVDSLNYRISMHKVEISGEEFTKLVASYRAKAEADKDSEYDFDHPHRFAYFELEPKSINIDHLKEFGDHAEFSQGMLKLEKTEDSFHNGDDWLSITNFTRDLVDLLEGFPEINEGHGSGRVLIWNGRGGTNRVFVWFEEKQTGYLFCQAGFG